jgi:hypothetical protein
MRLARGSDKPAAVTHSPCLRHSPPRKAHNRQLFLLSCYHFVSSTIQRNDGSRDRPVERSAISHIAKSVCVSFHHQLRPTRRIAQPVIYTDDRILTSVMTEIVLEAPGASHITHARTTVSGLGLKVNLKHRGPGLNDIRETTLSDSEVQLGLQDGGLTGTGPAKRAVVGDLPDNVRWVIESCSPNPSRLLLRPRSRSRSCTMFNRCDADTDFAPLSPSGTSESKTRRNLHFNST